MTHFFSLLYYRFSVFSLRIAASLFLRLSVFPSDSGFSISSGCKELSQGGPFFFLSISFSPSASFLLSARWKYWTYSRRFRLLIKSSFICSVLFDFCFEIPGGFAVQ